MVCWPAGSTNLSYLRSMRDSKGSLTRSSTLRSLRHRSCISAIAPRHGQAIPQGRARSWLHIPLGPAGLAGLKAHQKWERDFHKFLNRFPVNAQRPARSVFTCKANDMSLTFNILRATWPISCWYEDCSGRVGIGLSRREVHPNRFPLTSENFGRRGRFCTI
jgi:hypothetical protein